ncbi:hypothetical protein [Streptomyces sp. 604F]|uniref:hypothetical protein n=1 Tax=Streptomyces sp. 604F TaxID=1476754 RepID=UPI0031BA951F
MRVPIRGKHLRGWRRRHNRDHTKIRSLGERTMAILKSWRLLRKLRCSTTRINALVRAVVALELATRSRWKRPIHPVSSLPPSIPNLSTTKNALPSSLSVSSSR